MQQCRRGEVQASAQLQRAWYAQAGNVSASKRDRCRDCLFAKSSGVCDQNLISYCISCTTTGTARAAKVRDNDIRYGTSAKDRTK